MYINSRAFLLCVASDFLLNLSGLQDALSFLKDMNVGQYVNEYDSEK